MLNDAIHNPPADVIFVDNPDVHLARYVYGAGDESCLVKVVAVDDDGETVIEGLGYLLPSGEQRTVPGSLLRWPDNTTNPATTTNPSEEDTMATTTAPAKSYKGKRFQARFVDGKHVIVDQENDNQIVGRPSWPSKNAATMAARNLNASAVTDAQPEPEQEQPAPETPQDEQPEQPEGDDTEQADNEPQTQPEPQDSTHLSLRESGLKLTMLELRQLAGKYSIAHPDRTKEGLVDQLIAADHADWPLYEKPQTSRKTSTAKSDKPKQDVKGDTGPARDLDSRTKSSQEKAIAAHGTALGVCGRGFPYHDTRNGRRCCQVHRTAEQKAQKAKAAS